MNLISIILTTQFILNACLMITFIVLDMRVWRQLRSVKKLNDDAERVLARLRKLEEESANA